MNLARRFGLCERQDLDEHIVDRLLHDFRLLHPAAMQKNQSGHWEYDDSIENDLRVFLNDDGNVQQAIASSARMAAHAAGRKKGRLEAQIRVKVDGTEVPLTLDQASQWIESLMREVESLTKALKEERAKTYEATDAFGKIHHLTSKQVPVVLQGLTSANIALNARNKMLADEKNALLRQVDDLKKRVPGNLATPIVNTGASVAVSKKTGNVLIKTFDESLDDLAQMIANNPSLFLSARSPTQASVNVAKEADRLGVLTCMGRPWSDRYVRMHREKIAKRVGELMRANKPRIRVKLETAAA
jgi:hypothetical protein